MRVPTTVDLARAWGSLSPAQVDYIGFIALNMVFQGFLSGDAYAEADRVLQDRDARGAADGEQTRHLNELYTVIEDALPDLFGPPGDNPLWATHSQGALSDA